MEPSVISGKNQLQPLCQEHIVPEASTDVQGSKGMSDEISGGFKVVSFNKYITVKPIFHAAPIVSLFTSAPYP
jgi:hypothetical protein